MSGRVPNVLSIGGSDPSGGAGIQADLKTFAALGVYGCAAVTALTAQNTLGVSAILATPTDFLRQQIDAVFSDVRIDAVKIGMLGSADAVRTVAASLREHRPPCVVLDPVARSSTGASLLDADAVGALRDELLPVVTLVAPNAAEAGVLLGRAAPRTIAEARDAAAVLAAIGPAAALVTGGHLEALDVCTDVLHHEASTWELHVPRVMSSGTHGTGCTLSSAIAALLASGHDLHAACGGAQRFVAAAIRASAELRVGRGVTPLHQAGVAARDKTPGPPHS
jgi:hydroxymethylpyrimidine/phosphomethylpyrimidine kinase